MVKNVFFILPPTPMPSIFVRAQCLSSFEPEGWKFIFISGPCLYEKKIRVLRQFFAAFHYFSELFKIKFFRKNVAAIYFIKPSSILLLIVSRYFFRLKTFIDVNDPLHLHELLGRFSEIKFRIFMAIVDGAIFESLEYQKYCEKWALKKYAIIEDTPQFEISLINYSAREFYVVWFGSPETSNVLLSYIDHLKLFSENGYKVWLLGAAQDVVEKIKENGVSVKLTEKYDHKILIDIVSSATFSFVPMPNTNLFSLRGNLKAKMSLACGCLTIASKLAMHERLIDNYRNGYLFNTLPEFEKVLNEILVDLSGAINNVGRIANLEVVAKFNRRDHAEKICSFFESYNE
jgi:hypothetical protein